MSGGGKGGSSSSVAEIPKWMEEPAIRNIARAEDIQRMGYMPWYGPDVAAYNPTQQAAAQANIGAAEAFGLVQPDTLTAYQGMPQAQTFAGGVQGYSSAPMFEQGIETLRQKQPGTMAQYDALFGAGTQPGGGGTITGPSFTEQVDSGNFSSYSDYNPSTGLYDNQISDGGDISSYVMDDGSINWGATGNADYGTVDGVGVTNPDGAYGYGTPGGSGPDLGGAVGPDGGIDWNSVGNPDYGVVDGVGVTNPDGAYGYGGDSGGGMSNGGDLSGSVGSDGSVDFGGNDYGTVDGVGVENPDSGGSSGGGGGGGSYIATASTQALGEEGLSVFNNWRDYMASWHPTFTSSFGRYRVTAPKIVDAIDSKENAKEIYRDIWDNHLKPIYDLIVKDRDDTKALAKYKVMVKDLAKKFLKEKV
jgi:hypothetical protein